jgi:molecular chaperone DnaK
VGGSTNLQPFADAIEEKWDCPKIYPEHPDWSVAYGAAWLSQTEGTYQMAESVGVILSNGTFYPLVSAGDSLDGLKRTATFAIVEDTDTANVIFTNDNNSFYHYCHVPTFGFFQEEIDIEVTADQDQILHFAAKSRRRSSKTRQVWKYPSPKLAYKLPVTEVVLIDD